MALKGLLCCILMIWSNQCAVLDPALYLAPSPPLTDTKDRSAEDLWSSPVTRVERIAQLHDKGSSATEVMESAETFWPMSRMNNYGLRGIHIPLTFSISGSYGNYGGGTALVGSSYASVIPDTESSGKKHFSTVMNDGSSNVFNAYGKMSLAGSSYGSYGSRYPGTRIYGGGSGSSWSGWGNGKWGHYGKG